MVRPRVHLQRWQQREHRSRSVAAPPDLAEQEPRQRV